MKKKVKKYPLGGNITEENEAVMTPSSIMGIVGNGLNTLGQFIPQDNDNHGISSKGQSISSGIQTGLNAAGDIASSIPGVGTIVGGALKAGAFLTKGFTAIADAVKEKRNPKDERWNTIYNPQNAGTGISFGDNTNQLIEMALGGFVKKYENGGEFKQYQAPTHEEGGQMIDKNKNPTNNSNKAVAEIEKKENSYKDYIFSDTLLYKNNITYAQQAKKINDKYKDRQDIISKNSLDLELTELMKKNEQVKQLVEQQNQQLAQAVLKYGGNIPKMRGGGFNDYPSWLSDILQYEYQSGAADGTGLSNYGFNKNIDGTPATAPKSLHEATIRIGKQYLPLVKDYPSFIQPQLLDYKYNTGRSIKDLLLYSQGKISLADINSKNNYDKDYDTKYKSDIEKAMLDNPEEFYKKLVQARHDVAKTTKGYSLDNPNPAYEKTWKNRIDNFKYGDEQGGRGIAVSSKNNKAKLPDNGEGDLPRTEAFEKQFSPKVISGLDLSDPEYFTKLMQQNNVLNYGNIGPIEDKSYLGPVNKNTQPLTINKPLFDYKSPEFHPSQDINGIDIEKPGDDYGAGIPFESSNNEKEFSPYSIAGYGIKGAELLGHAIQAFKKPELVNPVYNPEENAIKNLMSKRKIDTQDLLNELELQNTATKENIVNNSSSVGTMISNLQKLHANDVSNIAKITSQTQQTNNAYRGEEANVLNSLGQQKASAQKYAEELNTKAKANVQNQRDKFLKESIGGLGDFLLKKDYINKENNFQMNILKSKGINFEPSDYEDWNKVGVDIVKFTGELESETDTEKRKIKMEELKKKYLEKGGTEEAWESNLIVKGLTNKYLK